MADEILELEDGELVASAMNGSSSSSAADAELRAQLDQAAQNLRHRGQPELARLAIGLVQLDLRDAMWILSDQVRGVGGGGDFSGDPALFDAFRHMIRERLLSLQETGYNERVISEAFPPMVLEAAQLAAAGRISGGFGAVPASAAAVHSLEKQTFVRAAGGGGKESVAEGGFGVTECSICFEEFVDGGQVTVMPCPCRRHKFHPDCIFEWLAISNMCPLCRHILPA